MSIGRTWHHRSWNIAVMCYNLVLHWVMHEDTGIVWWTWVQKMIMFWLLLFIARSHTDRNVSSWNFEIWSGCCSSICLCASLHKAFGRFASYFGKHLNKLLIDFKFLIYFIAFKLAFCFGKMRKFILLFYHHHSGWVWGFDKKVNSGTFH